MDSPAASRDTSAAQTAIPAGGASAPPAGAASGIAPGGAGSAPAVLTALILLCLSILAVAMLVGVGLPRLKLRAARLERPG
jgi:hypothetical protein